MSVPLFILSSAVPIGSATTPYRATSFVCIKKHITFHCSRHTFATLQLERDTDIYTIKGMLGHTNVKTTQIYGNYSAMQG